MPRAAPFSYKRYRCSCGAHKFPNTVQLGAQTEVYGVTHRWDKDCYSG